MTVSFNQIFLLGGGILLLLFLWCVIRLWKMEKRLRVLFQGKDAKGLEDVIMLLRKEAMETRKTFHALDAQVANMENRLERSVQKVGIVRFNPFRDAGGDHSFSLALLDEKHNGVVISSLYSRDGVRVYGKPIEKGSSSYQLSAEETGVIQKAVKES